MRSFHVTLGITLLIPDADLVWLAKQVDDVHPSIADVIGDMITRDAAIAAASNTEPVLTTATADLATAGSIFPPLALTNSNHSPATKAKAKKTPQKKPAPSPPPPPDATSPPPPDFSAAPATPPVVG